MKDVLETCDTWESSQPSLKYVHNPEYGVPPPKQNELLKQLGAPAVESFDYMLNGGFHKAIKDILPVEFNLKNGQRIMLRFNSATISKPTLPEGVWAKNLQVYPKESRMQKGTYSGRLMVQVGWSIDNKLQMPYDKNLGDIPIMLRSEACNLVGLNPKQLVEKGEHEQEWGGYFVVKGHERIIRMLTATRKNYPMTVIRDSWKRRGKLFTEKGVFLRCVKEDMTSTNNVLHYLQNGTVKFMCSYKKALHLLPLIMILKALTDRPDAYIYKQLTVGLEEDLYYKDRIVFMLRQVQLEGLYSREDVRRFIGKSFRVKMMELPEWYTDEQVCEHLLERSVCIHLKDDVDKFNLLVFMTRKLFAFAQSKCALEGMDPVMMQEVSLSGHIYFQLLKYRLSVWLNTLKLVILKRQRACKGVYSFGSGEMGAALQKSGRLDNVFENFLATGNIPATADMGLMQDSGLCIMAENINRMRYMSHFKAVHRGASFAGSRTSEVRQLKPDAWGFLCPVHTPDGAPCGLLNHFTSTCQIINTWPQVGQIKNLLLRLGMVPADEYHSLPNISECFVIMLEGQILGWIPDADATRLVDKLRVLKVSSDDSVPKTLEIVCVPRIDGGQYPGIFLFVGAARMMRPVFNLSAQAVELIGTFEQVYMNISITPEEAHEGLTTHQELNQIGFLSNLANLIPLPDFNQSPRNMYQCQMSKQTLGTPVHNWSLQTENKLYRLQTPTTPLIRPAHWDRINMDDFASGTNAIVAVISYTGYDMEDAMVINRGSLQRGLAYGTVYKSEFIDLKELASRSPAGAIFQRDPAKLQALENFIDADGLPYPGTRLKKDDPYCCYLIREEGRYVVIKYKGSETCYVDNVKLCGSESGSTELNKICITYRIPRGPQIGDKFASRAGQKGINSQQWLSEDLPFSESGLVPDIIFNPHGFPSRMTIAMMIEVMAGKSAAIHGIVHDASPFRFSEDNPGVDYHGRLLEQAGYDYYGTEKLYSGVDGREMTADIFFGIVYYQRLRHMVSDKFQVRSSGPIDILTHQPIKGRKRGGGIRFGEMERDGLISHGASYLLYDRLFENSDQSTTQICRSCGTFLPPLFDLPARTRNGAYTRAHEVMAKCSMCSDGGQIETIMVPYVYKYLLAELSSVNLHMCVKTKHV